MIDIDYLRNKIKEIQQIVHELKEITSKPYGSLSIEEKYAIRYQIIVLAESLGSICLHVATEDFGYEPDSYADCFKFLESKKFIKSEELIKLIRLRNLLVHRYCSIDDSKIYNAIKKDFKVMEELLKIIEEKYGI